jgi:pyruvate dehydrogenase E1 component
MLQDELETKNIDTYPISKEELQTLEAIQKKILWLATLIIHQANNVRPNPDKSKIGGHQASSASMVSILTALYFHFLKAGDRVAVKPHASPAYHALQYLLGNLPKKYLTELRAFKGLQAYPSRTKDPDPVDFSTGSVGLGAAAPAFAALTHAYALSQFGSVTSRRFIALVGDAELDEGNVWEAVYEEALKGLSNLIWIVDLNRQSLDRVVPGIRAAQLKQLFVEAGWNVLEAKYGRRLQYYFGQPGGSALRRRIDEMSNEEYQSLLRFDGPSLRKRLLQIEDKDLEQILSTISDEDLPGVFSNLGGHDMAELLTVLAAADAHQGSPTVIFAYTIKGWGLPIAGDRLNHSALLTTEQVDKLRAEMGIEPEKQWDGFEPDSQEGQLCARIAERLYRATSLPEPGPLVSAEAIPADLKVEPTQNTSTQDAFGRVLRRLADLPEVGQRIVTTSPDVSISTNLAGWINRVGVFSRSTLPNYEEEGPKLVRWQPAPSGRHIELGISEMNFFMLMSMLGLSYELTGQQLLPIGTVYDPFVLRGLDALIYGLYVRSKMIFAGTPSGITLSPEGGAHQSTATPSLGIELPHLNAYEPCFAKEVEWIMLEGLRQCCDRQNGNSTYLRLSTKLVEQNLLDRALARLGEEELRRQVIAGGYRLIDWRAERPDLDGDYIINIAATGSMIPEAVEATLRLHEEGVAANLINLTSPRRLYEEWQTLRQNNLRTASLELAKGHLETLFPAAERHAPIVTVQDGASHALAWLGSIFGSPVIPLGVDGFGQSGERLALYQYFGIDADNIFHTALTALDLWTTE